jgi:hypothetical protein
MEDEDLIDFAEARPSGLHSLKLPASWVEKTVKLVPAGRELVQASHHHQRTSQVRSPGLVPHHGGRQPRLGYWSIIEALFCYFCSMNIFEVIPVNDIEDFLLRKRNFIFQD